MRKLALGAALAVVAGAPALAFATDGYFQQGYGMKANGMGGVGIALPQDALAPATNPAGLTMIGNRLDIGATWFRPVRGADISGNIFPGVNGSYGGNDTQNFILPEFGYSRMLDDRLAAGVAVFGNGGMNTNYRKSPFTGFGGSSPAGVDLVQIFVAPTVAYKITPTQSIGVSLNLAYQQFGASGLGFVSGFSTDPANVSDNGKDSSSGWGVRFGWTGQVSDTVTLGATYQTKTRMGKFGKYRGLFANQGEFDIPENYGVGIAFKATPRWTLAADVEQINYSEIGSVGNPVDCLFAGKCMLGSTDGPGFGWRNTTVLKLGAAYEYSSKLTLRAGFNTLRQPVPDTQTFFNILAPGVIENHLTLGATWALSDTQELTVAYMHAFRKDVNGVNSIPPGPPPGFGGGNADLHMYEDSLGIAFGLKM